MDERTSFRTCPLCEATCGLAITTRGSEVTEHPRRRRRRLLARLHLPEGPAVAALDRDPDRLRKPMVRRGSTWSEVSWDDAFAEIDRQLPRIIRDHGRDAVAVYLGNPSAHNLALMLYPRALLRVLGSRNVYSASTVDQMPKQVSAGLMFGTALSVPVPDLDRTQYLLMLGADPLVSNGSLMTAPDVRGRLRAIKARGGRIVVVDPRRSRTAAEATEHHFIGPGTDAHFLMGVAHVIVVENLVKLGRLAEHVNGLDEVRALVKGWTPDVAASACGIPAATIRQIARDLATTERAAVYGASAPARRSSAPSPPGSSTS
jgi:anaerobic selenocysteine-containing dehydrogenase